MFEFIAQYWLGILFGVVCGIAAAFHKRIKAWYDTYRKKSWDDFRTGIVSEIKPLIEGIATRSEENDKRIEQQMSVLQAGLLSMQGDVFREKCKMLLSQEEWITIDQFEELGKDYESYKKLSGNGHGDTLFTLVTDKYESQFTKVNQRIT